MAKIPSVEIPIHLDPKHLVLQVEVLGKLAYRIGDAFKDAAEDLQRIKRIEDTDATD